MKFELCAGYEEQKWDGIVVPVLEGTLDHLQLPCEAEFQAVRNQAVFSGKRGETAIFCLTVLSCADILSEPH